MTAAIATGCPETFQIFQTRISINPSITRGEICVLLKTSANTFTQIFLSPSITRENSNFSDSMDTWSNTFDEWIKAAQAIYDIQRVNLLNPDCREISVRPGDEHYADFGN